MSDQRARIATHVSDTPGIHFNELARELDLASGQVQYHIRRLCKEGRIVQQHVYGQTHYYPPGYTEWERNALALFHRETARDILMDLVEHEPAAPATVANRLDIARSSLEWQLDRLIDQQLVTKRRDDRNRVALVLANPTDTAELLAEIRPSLSERMVDRFTRLLDQFLEDT